MTLEEFLATVVDGAMTVTVLESDGKELIKLNAGGYQQLLVSLLGREVAETSVTNPKNITVKLVGELSA